jgi:hypothetical protein
MILDISLAEAVRLVGHNHGTQPEELRRALRSKGVRIADTPELTRYAPVPARAILRLSRPKGKNWHWLLMWDGDLLDPAGMPIFWDRINKGWTVTSFLEIFS